MRNSLVIGILVLALMGCSLGAPPAATPPSGAAARSAQADTALRGRVEFPERYAQATPADVTSGATVTFMDSGGTTVATGKTNPAGSFTLTLGTFAPVTGGTYLLEAVKGLGSQAPGANAARFRTVLQWNGTGWLSCSNGSLPGTIVINALTTALAIEMALDPTNVPPTQTIGKVNPGTNPATLNPTPGPYVNHPDTEISQLAADLLSYLGADVDPVAAVPAILPSITSLTPTSAPQNAIVQIRGAGFSSAPTGNTVTFNGTVAQVLLARPTVLDVIVPVGATSGPVRVETGRGSVTSAAFTVSAGGGSFAVTGFSPAVGRAGTVVTLAGAFGTGAATPSVTFQGPAGPVAAEVTGWTATSMTVTVPVGAVPGSIGVSSGTTTAASSAAFDA